MRPSRGERTVRLLLLGAGAALAVAASLGLAPPGLRSLMPLLGILALVAAALTRRRR